MNKSEMVQVLSGRHEQADAARRWKRIRSRHGPDRGRSARVSAPDQPASAPSSETPEGAYRAQPAPARRFRIGPTVSASFRPGKALKDAVRERVAGFRRTMRRGPANLVRRPRLFALLLVAGAPGRGGRAPRRPHCPRRSRAGRCSCGRNPPARSGAQGRAVQGADHLVREAEEISTRRTFRGCRSADLLALDARFPGSRPPGRRAGYVRGAQADEEPHECVAASRLRGRGSARAPAAGNVASATR